MTTAATITAQEMTGLPDMKVSVRQVFGIDSDLEVPAYSEVDAHVPEVDADYRFDRATTLAILAGFQESSGDGHRLSRHRQVDPYRAGRGAAKLALCACQSRQSYQPYRSRRQGRHRDQGWQAGDRVQGRHPALGAAA